jgi:hypothetical protein
MKDTSPRVLMEKWATQRQWRKDNPDKVAQHNLRAKIKINGLDEAEVVAYFEGHTGLCDICTGGPREGRSRLDIDHDHVTGKFRGLLCSRCNLVLGMFDDNADRFQLASDYLRKAGN